MIEIILIPALAILAGFLFNESDKVGSPPAVVLMLRLLGCASVVAVVCLIVALC